MENIVVIYFQKQKVLPDLLYTPYENLLKLC